MRSTETGVDRFNKSGKKEPGCQKKEQRTGSCGEGWNKRMYKGGGKSGKGLVGRQALHYRMGKAYDFLQIILMFIQSRTVEHLSAPANKACPPIKHLTYSPLDIL